MKRLVTIIAAVILSIAVLKGCGTMVDSRFVRPPESLLPIQCVGILSFDNLTRYPFAGKIAADLLGVELYNSRKFNIMERAEVERVLMMRGIVPPPSVDVTFAVETGKVLGVEGIFAGTVNEYYYKKTSRATMDEEPVVGVTIRFIDVASSQILWTGTVTKVSGSVFLAMRDPINKIAQQAIEEIVSPFVGAVPERGVDPKNICWGDPKKLLLTAYAPPSPVIVPRVQTPPPAPVYQPPAPTPAPAYQPPAPQAPAPRPVAAEEDVPSGKPAEIAILNGSGAPKAAESVGKVLLVNDMNLVSMGNAKRSNYRTSIVYYHKGFKDQAEKLAGVLPKRPKLEKSSEYQWDITIVVGKDLAR